MFSLIFEHFFFLKNKNWLVLFAFQPVFVFLPALCVQDFVANATRISCQAFIVHHFVSPTITVSHIFNGPCRQVSLSLCENMQASLTFTLWEHADKFHFHFVRTCRQVSLSLCENYNNSSHLFHFQESFTLLHRLRAPKVFKRLCNLWHWIAQMCGKIFTLTIAVVNCKFI